MHPTLEGHCVASAGALLGVLASILLWCAIMAGGTYMLIALADYPPSRARSRWAVALAEAAAAGFVGLGLASDSDDGVYILGWTAVVVVGGGTVGKLLSCAKVEAAAAWTGGYPSSAGAMAAAWLLWASCAGYMIVYADRSFDEALGGGLFAPGLFALVAGAATYIVVELGNGCVCCRCCAQRCGSGEPAAADEATAEETGVVVQPQRHRLTRPMTALGAFLGLLAGIGLAYTYAIADQVHPYSFTGIVVLFGPPGALIGAAAAQFLVALYGLDGTTESSRWLDFTLALLSFGRRRQSSASATAKLFSLSCSVGDCHNMMCGCLARLRAFRWLFGSTDRFSFWAQAVSILH